MRELNHEVKRLLKKMISEVIEKGDLSPTEIDCVKDAYEIVYYMQATETMDEYGDTTVRHKPVMNTDVNSKVISSLEEVIEHLRNAKD